MSDAQDILTSTGAFGTLHISSQLRSTNQFDQLNRTNTIKIQGGIDSAGDDEACNGEREMMVQVPLPEVQLSKQKRMDNNMSASNYVTGRDRQNIIEKMQERRVLPANSGYVTGMAASVAGYQKYEPIQISFSDQDQEDSKDLEHTLPPNREGRKQTLLDKAGQSPLDVAGALLPGQQNSLPATFGQKNGFGQNQQYLNIGNNLPQQMNRQDNSMLVDPHRPEETSSSFRNQGAALQESSSIAQHLLGSLTQRFGRESSQTFQLSEANTLGGNDLSSIGRYMSGDLLSSEIKKIRLRVSDYYRNPILEPVLYKMWKLMLEVQFERTLLKGVSHLGHIPLAIEIYEKVIVVFERALGIYFYSSYYVAKRPQYKVDAVFFDRFAFDYISMFGVNILFLELEQLELINRKVWSSISYNFDGKNEEGGIQLRALECVESAFTDEKLEEAHLHSVTNLRRDEFQQTSMDGGLSGNLNGFVSLETNEEKDYETSNIDLDDKSSISGMTGKNLFGAVLNVDDVLKKREDQKREKEKKIQEMKHKKAIMQPFQVFLGVKDNPLPYDKKYLKKIIAEKSKLKQSTAKQTRLPTIQGGRFKTPQERGPIKQQFKLNKNFMNIYGKDQQAKQLSIAPSSRRQETERSNNSVERFSKHQNHVIDRLPLKERFFSLKDMEKYDKERYRTYKKFAKLQVYQVDQEHMDDSDHEKESIEKQARLKQVFDQIKKWPENLKLQHFQKYEMINLRTLKFKQKTNINPIITADFEPWMIKNDPRMLYEAKLQAQQKIQEYQNDVEQASKRWLHEKSVNLLANLGQIDEVEAMNQIAQEEEKELKLLNDTSSRNLLTQIVQDRGISNKSSKIFSKMINQQSSEHLPTVVQRTPNMIIDGDDNSYATDLSRNKIIKKNRNFISRRNDLEKEENRRKYAQNNLSFDIMSNANAMSITGISKENMVSSSEQPTMIHSQRIRMHYPGKQRDVINDDYTQNDNQSRSLYQIKNHFRRNPSPIKTIQNVRHGIKSLNTSNINVKSGSTINHNDDQPYNHEQSQIEADLRQMLQNSLGQNGLSYTSFDSEDNYNSSPPIFQPLEPNNTTITSNLNEAAMYNKGSKNYITFQKDGSILPKKPMAYADTADPEMFDRRKHMKNIQQVKNHKRIWTFMGNKDIESQYKILMQRNSKKQQIRKGSTIDEGFKLQQRAIEEGKSTLKALNQNLLKSVSINSQIALQNYRQQIKAKFIANDGKRNINQSQKPNMPQRLIKHQTTNSQKQPLFSMAIPQVQINSNSRIDKLDKSDSGLNQDLESAIKGQIHDDDDDDEINDSANRDLASIVKQMKSSDLEENNFVMSSIPSNITGRTENSRNKICTQTQTQNNSQDYTNNFDDIQGKIDAGVVPMNMVGMVQTFNSKQGNRNQIEVKIKDSNVQSRNIQSTMNSKSLKDPNQITSETDNYPNDENTQDKSFIDPSYLMNHDLIGQTFGEADPQANGFISPAPINLNQQLSIATNLSPVHVNDGGRKLPQQLIISNKKHLHKEQALVSQKKSKESLKYTNNDYVQRSSLFRGANMPDTINCSQQTLGFNASNHTLNNKSLKEPINESHQILADNSRNYTNQEAAMYKLLQQQQFIPSTYKVLDIQPSETTINLPSTQRSHVQTNAIYPSLANVPSPQNHLSVLHSNSINIRNNNSSLQASQNDEKLSNKRQAAISRFIIGDYQLQSWRTQKK